LYDGGGLLWEFVLVGHREDKGMQGWYV
jgi:hypothetical protein